MLALLLDGMPNKLIARRLEISEKTVKSHLTSIFRPIGVTDRVQAILWAERQGLRGDLSRYVTRMRPKSRCGTAPTSLHTQAMRPSRTTEGKCPTPRVAAAPGHRGDTRRARDGRCRPARSPRSR